MLGIGDVFSREVVDAVKARIPLEPLSYGDLIDMRDALMFIQEFERPMREEMERLATSIVFNNFPIFMNNKGWVRVKAKLVDYILPPDPGAMEEPKFNAELMDLYRKRKAINMMTQGASIGTHGVHHLRDDFREANPELVEAYDIFNELNLKYMRATPDELIESKSEGDAQKSRILGRMHLEHKNGRWVIQAEAIIMPVLIHETIKGMYELIAMSGLPKDHAIAEAVMEYTDTNRNEAIDLKYGEQVYAMVRDFLRGNFADLTDRRPEVMEYYLQELYQEEPQKMISVIEGMMKGNIPTEGIRRSLEGIYRDLTRDDAEAKYTP